MPGMPPPNLSSGFPDTARGCRGEWNRSGSAQEGQGKKCQWDGAIQPPHSISSLMARRVPAEPPGSLGKQLKYRNVNLN